jgi:hypothetical protein
MTKLLVAAMTAIILVGVGGCRNLTSPKDGYIIVRNVLSPVYIRTQGLEGVGWLKAILPGSSKFTEIFRNPSGTFAYDQPLPTNVWHCDPANGSEGCVAVLQVGDEQGPLATGKPQSRIYVCTENYVQKIGTKHCGERAYTALHSDSDNFPAPDPPSRLSPVSSGSLWNPANDMTHLWWDADIESRLFTGSHTWENTGNPWEPANPGDISGEWREWPWPGVSDPVGYVPDEDSYNVDIGAASVFIPWAWKDRFVGQGITALIGITTGKDADGNPIVNADGSIGLGLGELFVDGMRDKAQSISQYSENVKRWWDVLTDIAPRTDKSPEFHFHVTDNGQRQMCLVQYLRANNKTSGKIDGWYRIDQGIADIFIQLFGLGDCPTHNVKIRFCGEPSIARGEARFAIDPTTVAVEMEPYSVFKPICNNQFIPSFKEALPEILIPTAQISITEGLQKLVDKFSDLLGVDFRRVEITPSGAYFVVASTFLDPQYGTVGECLPEIGAPHACTTNLQPPVEFIVPGTGLTRPVNP